MPLSFDRFDFFFLVGGLDDFDFSVRVLASRSSTNESKGAREAKSVRFTLFLEIFFASTLRDRVESSIVTDLGLFLINGKLALLMSLVVGDMGSILTHFLAGDLLRGLFGDRVHVVVEARLFPLAFVGPTGEVGDIFGGVMTHSVLASCCGLPSIEIPLLFIIFKHSRS